MNNLIYENNMEALKKRFPGIAYLVEEHIYKLDNEIYIDIEDTKDGDKTVIITKDGRTLYTNGKYQTKKGAKEIVSNLGKLKRQATVFLIGMGNASIIKELLEQTKDDVNIAVFEPCINVFIEVMQNIDIREIFDKRAIGLVVEGLNGNERNGIIHSFLTIGNIEYMKKIVHPNYDELFQESVVNDLKAIQLAVERIFASENTVVRFSNIYAENIFKNLVYICDGYKADQICEVLPLDIPAIIVSAGPSLNKNIKDLKKAKNKAFIIAVDTALKPLLREDIVPDLFVSVDPRKPDSLFQIDGIEKIPMIAAIASSPYLFNIHKGKKIFFREGYSYIDDIFDKLGVLFRGIGCGGSVATIAYSFAYLSGFSTIILVGQDLAMTNNRTHADGTFQEVMEEINTTNALKVEGNVEDLVPTRADFKLYLDWFNEYIEEGVGVRVINATEGGAKIKNTEIMTLKDAIARECNREVNISDYLEKLKPMLSSEKRTEAVQYFHDTPKLFKLMKKRANEGKKLYKQLKILGKQNTIDKAAYKKLSKQISKKVKQIEDMSIMPIIMDCLSVANYLIRSEVFEEEETFEEEILELARKGNTVMEYIIQCVDLLLPLVEETVCKIEF